MKTNKIGALLGSLGGIAFFVPILIKCYQCEILLGVTATGVFMIAIGLIIILTSKVK